MPDANSSQIVKQRGRPRGAYNKSALSEKGFCKKLPQEKDQS